MLKIGSIREVQYPSWRANVVVVPKKLNKFRICVDFKDLNKACLKNLFPLPHIDQMIDTIGGHELLIFLDAYSGYNQIKLDLEDQMKTSFIMEYDTYCYNVIPFDLKNVGATYQRIETKMYEKQIGKTMKLYINMLLRRLNQA